MELIGGGLTDRVYQIEMYLWLKEGNNEAVIRSYGLELSIKRLLDDLMSTLNGLIIIWLTIPLNSAIYCDFIDKTFFCIVWVPVF